MAFAFPREYSFPAFYTPQPNLTTHHAQLAKWSALVLSYARHHALFRLSLSSAPSLDLFHNKTLERRLSPSFIRDLMEHMARERRVEFLTGSGSGSGSGGGSKGDVVLVYWKRPEEWAEGIEEWVGETGQRGGVLTVWELMNGENTRGAEFHGMDRDVMMRALGVLVKRGKAQIFGAEDSLGVKFF